MSPRKFSMVTIDVFSARPLEGRVAIITGGSRGIGAAVASLLAERGAAVVVSARDADRRDG